jgi:hypothetical protein
VTPYVSGAVVNATTSAVRVEWPRCVQGSRLLFRVRLLTTRNVQNAAVQIREARLRTCAAAGAATIQVPAGCFVLNPRGGTPCTTGVIASTWSNTKGLYKSEAAR